MRAQPPALVILDVGLPDVNGFEVFKRPARARRRAGRLSHRAQRRDRPRRRPGARRRRLRAPSRSRRASWWRGCARSCGARPRPARRGAAPRAPRRTPIHVDEGRRQIRFYGQPARAVALRVRPAEDARLAPRPCVLPRHAARAGVGRRHREPGPHRRRAREDAAREDEGDRARTWSRSARTAAAAMRWPRTCPRCRQAPRIDEPEARRPVCCAPSLPAAVRRLAACFAARRCSPSAAAAAAAGAAAPTSRRRMR